MFVRFPFVSRAAFDAVRLQKEEWHGVAMAERVRYDAVLGMLLSLKAAGASTPEPAPAPLARKPADPVAEVIADVAGNNSALRKQLGAYARAAKRAGTPTDEITHKLLHWDSDDDGTPE